MTITKIISSGTSGAESAALDIAIRLKIPHGGYTMEGTMLDKYRVTRRYKLMEKGFADSRSKDEANLHIADATIIFTHGELSGNLTRIDYYAFSNDHPCLHVDFDKMEPLQAVFHIRLWTDKHSAESLFVTGPREEDDSRIYQAVYDTLFSFLMLGKDEYPKLEQPEKERIPLPRTIEDAVEHLVEVLPLKDRVAIANMSADEVLALHFDVGTYIRNSFGLWTGNTDLMGACKKEAGKEFITEDEASSVILARLAWELKKTHRLRKV